jgi:fructose-1,6-bisphosphatase/inositol monophosphatase family enzyme
LNTAVLTTSNPDFLGPSERPVLDALRKPTAWRTFGGCCMSYGLVAAGRADLAIDAGLQLYDYAAFRPLIEGAGGVITDWQGRPITLASGPQVLAAGDAARHGEALALIAATLR